LGGASLVVVTAPNPKVMTPLTGGLAAGGKLLILARKSAVNLTLASIILIYSQLLARSQSTPSL